MDYIEGLSLSEGVDTILVGVDCRSKYAHFIELGHIFRANSIAAVFICDVVKLHGFRAPSNG